MTYKLNYLSNLLANYNCFDILFYTELNQDLLSSKCGVLL
jgi:hypothetical protein